MRREVSLRKRTRRLGRQRGSSRDWLRASRMRRCVRAFWLGRRFTRCCSTPNALPPRSRTTTRSQVGFDSRGSIHCTSKSQSYVWLCWLLRSSVSSQHVPIDPLWGYDLSYTCAFGDEIRDHEEGTNI